MKETLERIYSGTALSEADAKAAMFELTSGSVPAAQIAAFLSAYRMRQITTAELIGFRTALLERALPLDLAGRKVLDLCGTGGDHRNTFNISTLAAFTVAACGVPVIKHGNYSSTSKCGSSNLIEALGITFPQNATRAIQALDEAGITFIHAPLWHPAMKAVAPIRKELGVRTFFNMLGPLVNPARPYFKCLGVYDRTVQQLYREVLTKEGTPFAAIVSADGHDEISLTGPAHVATLQGNALMEAEAFGFENIAPEELLGGNSAEENAAIAVSILSGQGTRAQYDVVAANAGLALSLTRPESLLECTQIAREALVSGQAYKVLRAAREE